MRKIIMVVLILVGFILADSCFENLSRTDSRDYAPKGDSEIKAELNDEQLKSYYMGMEDTKAYLEDHNNVMDSEKAISNLELRTGELDVDPYAYFMGVAYYLVLEDNEGNLYEDKDCGNWLLKEYEKRESSKNREVVKKEPQIQEYDVEGSFRKLIKEAYPSDYEYLNLVISDEMIGHLVTADVYYKNGEKLCYMTLDMTTGKMTLTDVFYN